MAEFISQEDEEWLVLEKRIAEAEDARKSELQELQDDN